MSGGFINDRYNRLHKPGGHFRGCFLALILFLVLAFTVAAHADPQLTVNLVKGKWGDYRIDITCPTSEDCESIEILGKWPGTKVLSDSPTHTWVEFWEVTSLPAFWVRVYYPQGGWVDYEVPATSIPAAGIGQLTAFEAIEELIER